MRRETPVLARVSETATSDIETASFCSNCGDEEDHDEYSQNRQCAPIKETKNEGEAAKNFQPRQIEREPNSNGPGQNFVMIDVVSELDGIKGFKHPGINKNCGNDKIDNSPDERLNHLTIYRVNDSSSPRLPTRPRARTHQEAALPYAAAQRLPGRDRSFGRCNKQPPFFPVTTQPKTVAAIRSS